MGATIEGRSDIDDGGPAIWLGGEAVAAASSLLVRIYVLARPLWLR